MSIEFPHRISADLARLARRTTRVNAEVTLLCEKAMNAATFIDLIADRSGQFELTKFSELVKLCERLLVLGEEDILKQIVQLIMGIEAEYVGMTIAAHNERSIRINTECPNNREGE